MYTLQLAALIAATGLMLGLVTVELAVPAPASVTHAVTR